MDGLLLGALLLDVGELRAEGAQRFRIWNGANHSGDSLLFRYCSSWSAFRHVFGYAPSKGTFWGEYRVRAAVARHQTTNEKKTLGTELQMGARFSKDRRIPREADECARAIEKALGAMRPPTVHCTVLF